MQITLISFRIAKVLSRATGFREGIDWMLLLQPLLGQMFKLSDMAASKDKIDDKKRFSVVGSRLEHSDTARSTSSKASLINKSPGGDEHKQNKVNVATLRWI